MNTKRIISLVASLALVLSLSVGLTGCGDKAAQDDNQGSTDGEGTKYTVGICQLVQHEALDAATQGFIDALNEALPGQVEFQNKNASGDNANCSTIVNGFVSDGVDLIMANATGALTAAAPTIWTHLSDDRRNRILVLFDASIDPDAQNERYQVNRSIRALQNGGIRGQGLYNGTMVQSSSLPMQRNDFIFSAIGEELGMLGCLAVLLLLSAVIIRIIHVGIKSGNYMNRLICVGIAGMMASQILINVGVCLGLVPVIGLTLPFFSYGGSSLVTMFFAMGIVSGINMRPAPDVHARYIRPKS